MYFTNNIKLLELNSQNVTQYLSSPWRFVGIYNHIVTGISSARLIQHTHNCLEGV